jgi:hypothetical protein
LRIDGTLRDSRKRQELIDAYNKNTSYFCFLLTTQTGGVGITLTGADRVIIFDPAWNPASDNQAVDRAYRIGQMKNVIVYRFITCGTIEEKIYRKQIYKDTISKTATEKSNQHRYFKKDELESLMKLDDPNESETQKHLASMHSERKTYSELESHMEKLKSFGIYGISDHDLLFNDDIPMETFDHIDTSTPKEMKVNPSIKGVISAAREQLPVTNPYISFPQKKLPEKKPTPSVGLNGMEFKFLVMGVRLFGDQSWKKVLDSFPFVSKDIPFLKSSWELIKKNVNSPIKLEELLRTYDKELFPNGNVLPMPKLQREVICLDDEVISEKSQQPVVRKSPTSIVAKVSPSQPTLVVNKTKISPVENKKLNQTVSPVINTSIEISPIVGMNSTQSPFSMVDISFGKTPQNKNVSVDISPISNKSESPMNSLEKPLFGELRGNQDQDDSGTDISDLDEEVDYDPSMSAETVLEKLPKLNTKETSDHVAKRLSVCLGISTPKKKISRRRVILSDDEDEEEEFSQNSEYEKLLRMAKIEEENGNEIAELNHLIEAFSISSHDKDLEIKICKLGEKYNMFE